MRRSLVLYTALGLGAITAVAAVALWNPAAPLPAALENRAALEDLREGDMRKLMFHATPRLVPATVYERAPAEGGGDGRLADYGGKLTVVNFWATWCPPCLKEMPMLSDLQSELGGERFAVATIATGRNAPQAMADFFARIGVDNLPLHRDANSALARDMGVMGLPVTVILSPEGVEIARMTGEADWSSDSAKAILTTLLAPAPTPAP